MIEYITEKISINDNFDVQQNGININLFDELDDESYQDEDNLQFESKSFNFLNKDEIGDSNEKSVCKSVSVELSASLRKNTTLTNTSEKINSQETEEKKSFSSLKNIDKYEVFKKDFQNFFVEELPLNFLNVPYSFHITPLTENMLTPFFYDEITNANLFQKNKNSSINTKTKKNEQRKDIFREVHEAHFYIFSPGESDNYIRNLIKLISENNIDKNSSKKSNKRKKRKFDLDNIRKKIKGRFLKALKNALNEKLVYAGSKHLFDFLPQIFVSDITKKGNQGILNMTFREIFFMDFIEGKNKVNQINSQRCRENKNVIIYLEKNKTLSEKIGYEFFRNMKYYEIYNEYLNSKEFEKDIFELKNTESNKAQSDKEGYIKQYINLALNLNDFFSSGKKI
jgi:hypothetical protein